MCANYLTNAYIVLTRCQMLLQTLYKYTYKFIEASKQVSTLVNLNSQTRILKHEVKKKQLTTRN